uniref:Uncharacterized protein n=1 Tax=uncultured Candidatus Melainabacteria bacterium TaxID=2682970 RepID=A0A650EJS1_9BACT|nr:hypothetical protein Melaina855_2030 [uncultured Candidatus Melainabacteria bacterium]
MGLAASQARLLTITARKADAEFQSMALSHQKLALSRNMEQISTEYQNSLNATKLVYDYYGSGDSDMALTYGLLMSPSIYNDYYPKLITDAKDRVVLNSAYAAAAKRAGIPAEGLLGTPSSDVRNNFIEALCGENIITPAQATSIVGIPYGNTLGLGSTINASQSLTDISYDQLLSLFDLYGEDSNTAGVLLGSNLLPNTQSQYDGGNQQQHFIRMEKDGTTTDFHKGQSQSVTIRELLSSDTQFMIAYESGTEPIPWDQANQLQLDLAGSNTVGSTNILTWIMDQFSAVLGGTASSDTAIQYAYNCVYDLIYPSDKLANSFTDGNIDKQQALNEVATQSDRHKGWDNGFHIGTTKNSPKYMGMNYIYVEETGGMYHKGGNEETTVSVNLNNIAKAFLTSYVQYMEGINDSKYNWQKGDINNCNLYNGKNDDFQFTIVTETEIDDGDSGLYANFYDTMFNLICTKGWVENAQVDDDEYMSEMLKSGMVYLSSISDDGYYYQGNYSTDKAILEVSDTEAISKAEAKYNSEKVKLENKEETIDLKMKNLDTEISSLTTEYDTTKQVITKAIEKSFKRYEA